MCFFSVQLSKGMNKQNRSTWGVAGWAGGCGEGCCYQHSSVFGMGELVLWVPIFSLLFYGCALGVRFSFASDVSPLKVVTIIHEGVFFKPERQWRWTLFLVWCKQWVYILFWNVNRECSACHVGPRSPLDSFFWDRLWTLNVLAFISQRAGIISLCLQPKTDLKLRYPLQPPE